jgi:hypothetical protein
MVKVTGWVQQIKKQMRGSNFSKLFAGRMRPDGGQTVLHPRKDPGDF